MQLSSMADLKANMLLTMASIVVTLAAPQAMKAGSQLPLLVLIGFSLMTILLAAYAVMPKRPRGRPKPTEIRKGQTSSGLLIPMEIVARTARSPRSMVRSGGPIGSTKHLRRYETSSVVVAWLGRDRTVTSTITRNGLEVRTVGCRDTSTKYQNFTIGLTGHGATTTSLEITSRTVLSTIRFSPCIASQGWPQRERFLQLLSLIHLSRFRPIIRIVAAHETLRVLPFSSCASFGGRMRVRRAHLLDYNPAAK